MRRLLIITLFAIASLGVTILYKHCLAEDTPSARPSLRCTWGLLVNGEDDGKEAMRDDDKLQESITLYKKYDLNAVQLRFQLLTNSAGELNKKGKRFLKEFADNAIMVIPNLHSAQVDMAYTSASAQEYFQKVKNFIKSLDEYRKENPLAYNNIYAYFIGDDIGKKRLEGIKYFSHFIKNEIYNTQAVINRPLDRALMIDTADNKKAAAELKEYVQIIGGYHYPMAGKGTLYATLRDFLMQSNVEEQEFFTYIQAHTQFWQNAFFHNNADFSLLLPIQPANDPLPEGVNVASYMYQSLMAGAKRYIVYNVGYLKDKENAQDRLAELGIVNKLVKILWDPVLKDSSVDRFASGEGIKDTRGYFLGNILHFKDKENQDGALFIISNTQANYIVGNTCASYVSFDLQGAAFDRANKNLKVFQVQFPEMIPLSYAPSPRGVTITIPHLYDNAIILITSDSKIIDAINQGLASEAPRAKDLLKEALRARLLKTQKEIADIQATGFVIQEHLQSALTDIAKTTAHLDTMTEEQIRLNICAIGDFQVNVYKEVLGIKTAVIYYPDGDNYREAYWSNPENFKAMIPSYLATGRPQQMHFFLLSEYLTQSAHQKITPLKEQEIRPHRHTHKKRKE